MGFDTVLWDVTDGTATLTMNRPDKLNAFDGTMLGSSVLVTTEDAREGVRAFHDKRPPRWSGR